MTTCLQCSHAIIKGAPMAALGFCKCARMKPWQAQSLVYQRKCDSYAKADAVVIEQREEWVRKKLG